MSTPSYIDFEEYKRNLAEKILKEYVDVKDVNGSETVELLPLTIIDMMLEYGEWDYDKYGNAINMGSVKCVGPEPPSLGNWDLPESYYKKPRPVI